MKAEDRKITAFKQLVSNQKSPNKFLFLVCPKLAWPLGESCRFEWIWLGIQLHRGKFSQRVIPCTYLRYGVDNCRFK